MTKENKRSRDPGNYRISLVDQVSQRVLWHREFTRALLWIWAIASVVIGLGLVYCLIAFTPLRLSIPGYPDARSRNAAVQNALKIDSLEQIITRWDLYAENLSRVLDGQEAINVDSVIRRRFAAAEDVDPGILEESDSLLRKAVISSGQFALSDKPRTLPLEGRHFFSPVKGVVSGEYEPAVHPWVDVSAPAGSLVLSVLDGTVVFTGWNDENGYTIGIQHEGDVLTFYKHNQKLLKDLGDHVSAGMTIALLGSSGQEGDHLRFELWYAGDPVDPAMYINF